jgi:cytochrome c oxidase assembly factor CtaG
VKDFVKSLIFIIGMLGIIAAVCILGTTLKCFMYIETFMAKHIVITIIIAVLLLISYIKSIRRKWSK